MKVNKSIFVTVMLVMMIACVSAVSAADINGTDDVNDDIVVDEVNSVVEEDVIDDVSEDVVEESTVSATNPVTLGSDNYSTYFDSDGYFNDASVDEVTFDGSFGYKSYVNDLHFF